MTHACLQGLGSEPMCLQILSLYLVEGPFHLQPQINQHNWQCLPRACQGKSAVQWELLLVRRKGRERCLRKEMQKMTGEGKEDGVMKRTEDQGSGVLLVGQGHTFIISIGFSFSAKTITVLSLQHCGVLMEENCVYVGRCAYTHPTNPLPHCRWSIIVFSFPS